MKKLVLILTMFLMMVAYLTISLPALIMGFIWELITLGFNKGRDLPDEISEYVDKKLEPLREKPKDNSSTG